MAKIKRRGESGAAKNFITRNQAIRKLQISLADFRRLCIFKAIYPREPRSKKKANRGSSAPTTFYYTKDIQYLLHEPVLQKFREHKIFARKLNRAVGRGEWGAAKSLEENKPTYTLDHLVKERYPTFLDAIRDIDDALCMLFLFSQLSTEDKIPAETIENCGRLCSEWQHYVIKSHSLRKMFLSIKGVYYRAEVKGQEVTWLVPYKFAQSVPSDVDFRIMMTFIEFYQTSLGFVNFKLFSDLGLVYPPHFDEKLHDEGAGLLSYNVEKIGMQESKMAMPTKDTSKQLLTLPSKLANLEDKSIDAVDETTDNIVEDDTLDEFVSAKPDSSDVLPTILAAHAETTLFQNLTFFVSREVPLSLLALPILAFSGRLAWDPILGAGSPFNENDTAITHQVVDRPQLLGRHPGRAYVVPQWIVDSVNKRRLLPIKDYTPGALCPPHLSPFVENADYDPEADVSPAEEAEISEEVQSKTEDPEIADEEDVSGGEEDDDRQDILSDDVSLETSPEAQANEVQRKKEKKSKDGSKISREKDDELEMRKMMMSRRKRKLYEKMQYSNKRKADEVEMLKRKKRKALKDSARSCAAQKCGEWFSH